MIVARGEDDGAGLVPNDALGDSALAKVLGDRPALRQYGVGADNLDGEGVASRAGLQLVDLLEFRFPERRLGIALLRLWWWWWWCSCRHSPNLTLIHENNQVGKGIFLCVQRACLLPVPVPLSQSLS